MTKEEQQVVLEDGINLPILVDEVTKAIPQLKEDKFPGLDNLHAEFIKLTHTENIQRLTAIVNNIYGKVEIPKIWLPKKARAKSC